MKVLLSMSLVMSVKSASDNSKKDTATIVVRAAT